MARLSALRDIVRDRLLRLTGFDIRARYVDEAPSHQNALDLFRGEWASRLPGPYVSGEHDLFADPRIEWLVSELGGVGGLRVLDCGPLEGGHSHALERAGAEVLAVEANTRAFLRCLVAKEVLGMRARFQLGDFVALLEQRPRFDLIVASGVLYHLTDPVRAIALAARCTDRLYLWTHYHESGRVSPTLRFSDPQPHEVEGFAHTLHRQFYATKLGNRAFFGGAHASSCWLGRDDLLGALKHFGFDRIRIHFDKTDARPGPNISLLALKSSA